MDQARSPKLAIIAATVMTEGHKRAKPSDCFIEKAQTTSNNPATTRTSHAMAASFQGAAGPSRTWTLERGRTWPRPAQVARRAASVNLRRLAAPPCPAPGTRRPPVADGHGSAAAQVPAWDAAGPSRRWACYAFADARSMPTLIRRWASSTPSQPRTLTHLFGSRSL